MVVITRRLGHAKKQRQLDLLFVDNPITDYLPFMPCGPEGKYTFVDSFCGMGGVTEGFLENEKILVTHAINHSPKAIKCYKKNNPNVVCFEEDFVDMNEKLLPRKVNFFWMSAECTHHSIAAGGNSRDPDSRSLPEHVERYIRWCNPDYVLVENVKEFLTWGPVEEKKDGAGNTVMKYNKKLKCMAPVMRPVNHLKCTFYNAWVKKIKSLGYEYEFQIINAADFGAATSRKRYFGIFARKGLKIVFPEPTHAKDHEYTGLKPWVPCRKVIKLYLEGHSIFGRKYNMSLPKRLRKELEDKTLKRIAYGIKKYFLDDFIAKSYGADGQVSSLAEPLHTVRRKDCHAYIKLDILREKIRFITQNIHGSLNAHGINVQSIDATLGSPLCADSKKLVTLKTDEVVKEIESEKRQFIMRYFGAGGQWKTLDEPLGSMTTINKEYLVTVEFLCDVIKDIKMRYLDSEELAAAMGFKKDMYMGDTETDRKLHIGNAVSPYICEHWSYALTA